MPNWEHCIIQCEHGSIVSIDREDLDDERKEPRDRSSLVETLNVLGREGFECAGVTTADAHGAYAVS